jgi:hypothetical protein
MNVPDFALPILTIFQPAFSTPTYNRFLVLLLGTLLTTGRRTITNVLRTVRQQHAPGHVSSSHRVFSQRHWSTWTLAQCTASQGLSAEQVWLQLSDLERVELGKGGQRSGGQPRVQGVEESAAPWTPPSCGHTYPDVLRLRDEVRADGTFVRLTDCRSCGRAESAFPARMLAEDVRRDLEARGSLRGIGEDAIKVVRPREERRRRKRNSAGRWWQRLWWRSVVRPLR